MVGKNKLSKIASWLLAILVSVPMLPVTVAKADEPTDSAADAVFTKTRDNTLLGTYPIANPNIPASTDSRWGGSYVYYGSYCGRPILWRVLAKRTTLFGYDTLFLDSDKILFQHEYDGNSNAWIGSEIRKNLNGSLFLTANNVFDTAERNAIAYSKIAAHNYSDATAVPDLQNMYNGYAELQSDKIFFLDAEDVVTSKYGYYPALGLGLGTDTYPVKSRVKEWAARPGEPFVWWLRTDASKTFSGTGAAVGTIGKFEFQSSTQYMGVAPACNVHRNAVLFSSAVSGLPGEQGTYYKLTIFDEELSLTLDRSYPTVQRKNQARFKYNLCGADIDAETQLSYLITREDYNPLSTDLNMILFYGKAEEGSDGWGYFTLPSKLHSYGTWGKDYHVYVFAENVTGSKTDTDKASLLCELSSPKKEIILDLTEGTHQCDEDDLDALIFLQSNNLINRDYTDGGLLIDVNQDGKAEVKFVSANSTLELTPEGVKNGISRYYYSSTVGPEYYMITFDCVFNRPAVPKNVKAVVESPTSVKVSWSASNKAEGYQVSRATSSKGSYTALGSVKGTNRTCSSLSTGTKYYFKVRAYREFKGVRVYSEYSTAASATPLPAAPSGVKAVSSSSTSVNVFWNDVSGVTGYQVSRSTSRSGTYTVLGSVTDPIRECTGLTCGKTYYFKVRAYKEVNGEKVFGPYSSVVSIVPLPAKPAGLKTTVTSPSSVKLSWNAVSGATGYQVSRATEKNGTYKTLGSVTDLSRECPGLTMDKTYYFKVRAYKVVNGERVYGPESDAIAATPKLLAPTSVKATVSSSSSVTVSWKAVGGATGYEVWRSTSANGTYSRLGSVTTTSRKCTGLSSGKTYYFKVRAYTEINGKTVYSEYSSAVSATPK